jgi:hypothetical protein
MAIVFGPTKWQNDYFISYPIQSASLGDPLAGGYLICRNGGVAWIVAPNTTEVTRDWNSINDAVTTAEANAACGDWFVPTCGQLKNPGYSCRTHWDSYSPCYWSSTGYTINYAWGIRFTNGSHFADNRTDIKSVRAFRCVSY